MHIQSSQLEINDTEVKAAFDDMRRRRGLLSARELEAWRLDSGSSLHALEDLATNRARVAKLRDLIAGDRVDGFFEAHRGDFETIAVALPRVASKRIAAEITAAVGGRSATSFRPRRTHS